MNNFVLQINYLFSKNLLLLFYVETQGIARKNYENAKKVTLFKFFMSCSLFEEQV